MQPDLSFPSSEWSPELRPERRRSTFDCSVVYLEFNVRADTRRLFHALTVPEYLETWLSLPGHGSGCSMAAARSNDDYVIEHYCEGRPALSITGTYSLCRRRNVMFSWRVDGMRSVPETEVDIRLRGNFENTTLTLRHSGFASSADCVWHKALWLASMHRLIALYDAPGSRSGVVQPAIFQNAFAGINADPWVLGRDAMTPNDRSGEK
jgi:Activator of Hsp90 ATPase homolog 1-like protein